MRKLMMLGLAATLSVGAVQARAADTSTQDKKFVMDAGEGSLGEIEMAKLALKNSQNPKVKAFAERMIKDHTMLIEQMKPFADKMSVPPPSMDKWERAMKDEYQRLQGKTGDSFDKDYVQTMTDDHHKDVADFIKERDTTANMQLKATVAKGETVVAAHRNMIDAMAKQMGLNVPSKP